MANVELGAPPPGVHNQYGDRDIWASGRVNWWI